MKIRSKRFSILLAGLYVLVATVAWQARLLKMWFTPLAAS